MSECVKSNEPFFPQQGEMKVNPIGARTIMNPNQAGPTHTFENYKGIPIALEISSKIMQSLMVGGFTTYDELEKINYNKLAQLSIRAANALIKEYNEIQGKN